MRDLCELTGLSRQTIHYYIREGLLDGGQKTGKNSALYTRAHVDRLRLIQKLKEERFLPLKAIKALLRGGADTYSAEQSAFLAQVRARLGASVHPDLERAEFTSVNDVSAATGADVSDILEAIHQGHLSALTEGDEVLVARRDVWLIELFVQMRALGFTRELGFTVSDLSIYEEAMSQLFAKEAQMALERLGGRPPDEVATMIERALPIIHGFLARYHETRLRDFFEAQDVSTKKP